LHLKKAADGRYTLFGGSKHPGKTLEQIALEDPNFLTYVRQEASAGFDQDAFYALTDVMERFKIPLFKEVYRRKK
jgi:hypothetical protein